MYSRISGTGRSLPERVLTTPDAAVRERTGIASRHVVAEGQTTADLATEAARNALAAAGIDVSEIDLLIVATTTPDVVFPNLGCLLQDRLGISGCPAFSLEAGASGFVYAMSVADRFIAGGQARHALVIGAESLSRLTPGAEQDTLFADGAGAVVLEPADNPGLIACRLGSDPSAATAPDDQVQQITRAENLGPLLAKLGAAVKAALATQRHGIGDVDWLIPHQASGEIIDSVAGSLGIAAEKTVRIIADHGNVGAASVPIALDVAIADGRIGRGDLLLLETLGGGLTWGSALIVY